MPHTASPDTTTSPTASTLTCTHRSSGTAPGADSIIVELIHGLDDVVLRVSDDDPHGGLPVDECRGQGLRTLRRRVEAAGGDLRIGSRSGGGVLLEARMPAGTDSAVDEDGVASGREGAAS